MIESIVATCGTPVYIYDLQRLRNNYAALQQAFPTAHIHYSIKANGNLSLLKTLAAQGAGMDAVSAGEIYRARQAGVPAEKIVFAGVGKTEDELRYALEQHIGWFNVENVDELAYLNRAAGDHRPQIALRLNPGVTANTHPYIATGHGGAKFGLTAEVIRDVLDRQSDYPKLDFSGLHVHIGSQLHDTDATTQAIQTALDVVAPYSTIRTINIGGGLPVAYHPDEQLPSLQAFADALLPLLETYHVLLEPGRSIVADAGTLITRILYVKRQAGQTFYIVDASIAELIRPALYQAHHEITPVNHDGATAPVQVVGPVCETADVLGRYVPLPEMQPGDLLAIHTAGAYGMVMASNYNARPRPAEVVVDEERWQVARQRESWDDLLRHERI